MKRPKASERIRRVPSELIKEPRTTEQLKDLADRARYLGSGEHKSCNWEGIIAAPRRDANICPVDITGDQANKMLRAGIKAGNISEDFDGDMPRRVWYVGPQGIFEARLTDRSDRAFDKPAGYKGWPEHDQKKLPSKPRALKRSDDEI